MMISAERSALLCLTDKDQLGSLIVRTQEGLGDILLAPGSFLPDCEGSGCRDGPQVNQLNYWTLG